MRIFLIGYRGTGKTTLSKLLAKSLNCDFVDTDDIIIKNTGCTIPEIFSDKGEDYFRTRETEALKQAVSMNDVVIATGGGVILRKINRDVIKKNGICVYLMADAEVIFSRIYNDTNRPPLTDKSPMDEINELLEKRGALYEDVAQITVDTGKLDIESAMQVILDEIKKKG